MFMFQIANEPNWLTRAQNVFFWEPVKSLKPIACKIHCLKRFSPAVMLFSMKRRAGHGMTVILNQFKHLLTEVIQTPIATMMTKMKPQTTQLVTFMKKTQSNTH